MDNAELGQEWQVRTDRRAAQEMTEEIDRATNFGDGGVTERRDVGALGARVVESSQSGGVGGGGADSVAGFGEMSSVSAATEAWVGKDFEEERTQAGRLGGRVLTYNPDAARGSATGGESGVDVLNGSAKVYEARSEARIHEMVAHENGERAELSGEESRIQVEERLIADKEDIDNESGKNGRYVQELMGRNSEEITANVMNAAEKITKRAAFRPSELDQGVMRERTIYLKNVFNRILGARN